MTPPASVTAYLLGEAGSFRDQRFPLNKPRVVFGRDEQACDIVLAQGFVSRTHAVIETDASDRTILRASIPGRARFSVAKPLPSTSCRRWQVSAIQASL